MDKQKIKKFVPDCIWLALRKRSILKVHKNLGAICDSIIDDYLAGKVERVNCTSKKNLSTDKIIWQYWGQGYEPEKIHPVVKICFESVEKFKGDYTLIRLSDENYAEYIDLPEVVLQKKSTWTPAAFSDILRLALVTTYGGVWLDATIMLTDMLPERYRQMPFFMFQRDPDEPHKKWWENSYAYYYGWHKDYKVTLLTSVIFSTAGCGEMVDFYSLMTEVWRRYEVIPDYFLIMVMWHEYVAKTGRNCPVESDCVPQYLAHVMEPDFFCHDVAKILQMTGIHKFNTKVYDLEAMKSIGEQIQSRV